MKTKTLKELKEQNALETQKEIFLQTKKKK